jgi:iron-sulfur cluster repair protein YtfE (RIC family)
MSIADPTGDPPIDESTSVNEVMLRYPEAIRILNARGVDTCCGGADSLESAAISVGLRPEALVAEVMLGITEESRR